MLVQVACRRPFGPLAAGLALAPRGGRGLGVRLFLPVAPFGPTRKFKGRGALCSDSESVQPGTVFRRSQVRPRCPSRCRPLTSLRLAQVCTFASSKLAGDSRRLALHCRASGRAPPGGGLRSVSRAGSLALPLAVLGAAVPAAAAADSALLVGKSCDRGSDSHVPDFQEVQLSTLTVEVELPAIGLGPQAGLRSTVSLRLRDTITSTTTSLSLSLLET